MTSPESELYSPLWLPAISFGVIGNVVLSVTAIIALLSFLRRSKRMPAVAISWLLLNLLLVAADYAIASRLPGFTDQPFAEFDAIKELVLAGFMAAIWVPYLVFSKSVDAVFTSDWPARVATR